MMTPKVAAKRLHRTCRDCRCSIMAGDRYWEQRGERRARSRGYIQCDGCHLGAGLPCLQGFSQGDPIERLGTFEQGSSNPLPRVIS